MDTGDHIWQVEYGSEIVQFATANAATNSADKKWTGLVWTCVVLPWWYNTVITSANNMSQVPADKTNLVTYGLNALNVDWCLLLTLQHGFNDRSQYRHM